MLVSPLPGAFKIWNRPPIISVIERLTIPEAVTTSKSPPIIFVIVELFPVTPALLVVPRMLVIEALAAVELAKLDDPAIQSCRVEVPFWTVEDTPTEIAPASLAALSIFK